MDAGQDLAELKAHVDALQQVLTSKQETASALAELRLKALEDKLALSDRFDTIQREHESWKTLATIVGIVIFVAGVVLTILGQKSLDSFLKAQIQEHFGYAQDLAYGLSLADKHPSFALPYLLRCFEQKQFDEPLVISLLRAADSADDWETERHVMQELRRHPIKLISFSDALTYNEIGIAELNLSFGDASHLDLARQAFERGIQVGGGNPQMIWYLHTNLWRYYLAKEDIERARREVEIAKNIDPPPDVDSWEKASQWAWFKEFFRTPHKIDRQQIEEMYKEFSRT